MKLTKTYLLDLIKEELETILSEQPTKPLKPQGKPGNDPEVGFDNYRDHPEVKKMALRAYTDTYEGIQNAAKSDTGDLFYKSATEKSVDFLLDTVSGYYKARRLDPARAGTAYDPGHEFLIKQFKRNRDFIANRMKLRYMAPDRDADVFDQKRVFEDMVMSIVNEFNDFYRSAEKSRHAAIDAKYEKEKAAYDAARARGDYTNKLPAGSHINRLLRKGEDYLTSPSPRRPKSFSASGTRASADSKMGGLNEEKKDKNQLILENHRKNRKVHPVTKDNWWYDA